MARPVSPITHFHSPQWKWKMRQYNAMAEIVIVFGLANYAKMIDGQK